MIPEIRSELSTLHDGRWRTADITPTSAAAVASGSPTDVYDPTIAFATMVPRLYVDPVAGEKDTHTQRVALEETFTSTALSILI